MGTKERELKQAEEFGAESQAIQQMEECGRCCSAFKKEILDAEKAGMLKVVDVVNGTMMAEFPQQWQVFLKEYGLIGTD